MDQEVVVWEELVMEERGLDWNEWSRSGLRIYSMNLTSVRKVGEAWGRLIKCVWWYDLRASRMTIVAMLIAHIYLFVK